MTPKEDDMKEPEEIAEELLRYAFLYTEKHHQLQSLSVEIASAIRAEREKGEALAKELADHKENHNTAKCGAILNKRMDQITALEAKLKEAQEEIERVMIAKGCEHLNKPYLKIIEERNNLLVRNEALMEALRNIGHSEFSQELLNIQPIESWLRHLAKEALSQVKEPEELRNQLVTLRDLVKHLEDALTAEREARVKAEAELAGLLSNDTGDWKSATFQKIKGLEAELADHKKNHNSAAWGAVLNKRMDQIRNLEAELAKEKERTQKEESDKITEWEISEERQRKIDALTEKVRQLEDELTKTRIFYCQAEPCYNVAEVYFCEDCHKQELSTLREERDRMREAILAAKNCRTWNWQNDAERHAYELMEQALTPLHDEGKEKDASDGK